MECNLGRHAVILILLLGMLLSCGCEPGLSLPPALPPGDVDPLVQDLISPQIARIEKDPSSAEEHGTLGLMYEANEMWEPATRALENATRLDPSDPVWTLHLHRSRNSVGKSSGELARLESLVSRFSHVASFLYTLGLSRLENGDIEGARRALEESLQLAPEEAAPMVALSELELLVGNPRLALNHARQALKRAPGQPAIRNARGQALRALGEEEAARADLEAGLNSSRLIFPDAGRRRLASYFAAPQMIINHSADLIGAGYPQRAEQLLHKVLLSRPGDRDALNNLALALRAMGRTEEAEVRLLEALKSDPNYFPTLINLSDICLNLKRPAAAQHHATKAIQIDAENPIAHKLLGMSLIQQRLFPESVQAFEKSLRLQPDDFECHAAASEAALASGDLDAATTHLAAASRLMPSNLPVQVNLIHLLIRKGSLEEADQRLKDLFKQVGNHPQLVNAYDALRRARTAQGGN